MSDQTKKIGPPTYRPASAPRPPKHIPKMRQLIQGFAADPFDGRFHTSDKNREHTLLGLLIEAWWRAKTHPEESNARLLTLLIVLENTLKEECPDAVDELEKMYNA